MQNRFKTCVPVMVQSRGWRGSGNLKLEKGKAGRRADFYSNINYIFIMAGRRDGCGKLDLGRTKGKDDFNLKYIY